MYESSDGYLPCPDTHPWEYEINNYQMCCPDEPVEGICEKHTEAIYRDYDNGEDTDGKN